MSEHPVGVTGEAVVLELRLAKLASRSLALAVDLTVQLALFLVGTLVAAGGLGFVDDTLATALALVFYVLVVVGYPVAMETATRGRSLGKMALGLRVVREDGGPITFRHAFVRGLLSVVEIWITFGSVALVTSLASAKGKRLGDFLAGTVVVRERIPVRGAPLAAMPPPLAAWAAGLDLSQVPDDLALAARQFLARIGELAPCRARGDGCAHRRLPRRRHRSPAAARDAGVGVPVGRARRAPAAGAPADGPAAPDPGSRRDPCRGRPARHRRRSARHHPRPRPRHHPRPRGVRARATGRSPRRREGTGE